MTITLTLKGLDVITAAIASGTAPPKFVGWGTSASALTSASTDLTTPKALDLAAAGPARGTGTVSVVTTTNANDTIQVTDTRTAGGAGTVQEMGLFSTSATATLVIAADSQAVLLANGDSIASTWKLKFS